MDTQLHAATFTEAMHASFVEVGLLPRTDGSYSLFSYNKKGYLTTLIPQVAVTADAGPTFGDVAMEMELTNRPSDDSGSDGSDDSDDSDDDSSSGRSDMSMD